MHGQFLSWTFLFLQTAKTNWIPPNSCYIKAFAWTDESKNALSPVSILCFILDPLLIQENTDVILKGHLVKVPFEDKGDAVIQTASEYNQSI